MATYTNFNNKIKETLNVGYNDRITLLHARLLNDLNEYRGYFEGVLSAIEGTVKELTAANISVGFGKIDNTILKDCKLEFGDGRVIDFMDLTADIESMSVDVCVILPNKINYLSTTLSNLIIEVQSLEHYADDISISLTGEALERYIQDKNLECMINDKYNELSSKDKLLDEKIDELDRTKTVEILSLSGNLIDYTDQTKHYRLYSVPTSDSTYKIEEFTLNKIECYFPDFFIKDENNNLIGKVFNCLYDDTESGKALTSFTFDVFTDKYYDWITTGARYDFKKNNTVDLTVFSTGKYNFYEIKWENAGTTAGLTFTVYKKTIAYYDVSCGNTVVGHIYDSLCADNYLSGNLDLSIENLLEDFEVYKAFPFIFSNVCSEYRFENPENHKNKYIYNCDQSSFTLIRDYSSIFYRKLAYDNVEFGKIISGNVKYSDETCLVPEFESVSVSLSTELYDKYGILKKDYVGTYILDKNNKFSKLLDDNWNFLEISSAGEAISDIVLIRHESKFYQYELSSYDMSRGEQIAYVGQIQIPNENTIDISETKILTLSVTLSNVDERYPELDGVYVLLRQQPEVGTSHIFKCYDKRGEDFVVLTYDSLFNKNFIYLSYKDYDVVKKLFYVDDKKISVYLDNSRNLKTSGFIRQQIETLEWKYGYVPFDSEDIGDTKTFKLDFDINDLHYRRPTEGDEKHTLEPSTDSKKITLTIPTIPYSNRGREFDVGIHIANYTFKDTEQFIWVEFLTNSFDDYRFYYLGKDVTGNGKDIFGNDVDNRFYINKILNNLRFIEFEPNHFNIVDLRDSELDDRTENLRKDLNELSGKVIDLSSQVISNDTDISALSSACDYLSSAIDVNSEHIEILSDNVADIYDRIQGGLNYKGLVLMLDYHGKDPYTIEHLSNLFYSISADILGQAPYFWLQPNSKYVPSTILSNGYMYYVGKTKSTTSTRWTIDGVELEVGDYIIIHNRSGEIDDVDGVKISNITSVDIDVVDTIEKDKIIVENLEVRNHADINTEYANELTGYDVSVNILTVDNMSADQILINYISATDIITLNLTAEGELSISEIGVNSLSAYKAVISTLTALSEISAKDIKVTDLTVNLSNLHFEGLSTAAEICSYLLKQINSNDDDISSISTDLYITPDQFGNKGLSGKVDWLFAQGKKSMEYRGTMVSVDPLYSHLSDLLSAQFPGDDTWTTFVKNGWVYRLSSDYDHLYDCEGFHKELHNNDYLIFNKDTIVRFVKFSDFDLIYDGTAEAKWLFERCAHLSGNNSISGYNEFTDELSVNSLSVATAYVDKLNIDNLSVNNLSTNNEIVEKSKINSLSTTFDAIHYTDIDLTPKEICADLQDLIISNDNDISVLSTDLSDLSGLYHNTFTDLDNLPNKLLIKDRAEENVIYLLTICHGLLEITKVDYSAK